MRKKKLITATATALSALSLCSCTMESVMLNQWWTEHTLKSGEIVSVSRQSGTTKDTFYPYETDKGFKREVKMKKVANRTTTYDKIAITITDRQKAGEFAYTRYESYRVSNPFDITINGEDYYVDRICIKYTDTYVVKEPYAKTTTNTYTIVSSSCHEAESSVFANLDNNARYGLERKNEYDLAYVTITGEEAYECITYDGGEAKFKEIPNGLFITYYSPLRSEDLLVKEMELLRVD